MSWSERDAELGEGDGDDEEEEEFKNYSDRIVFLIDVRERMFQANAAGEIQFVNCLKVVLSVMKTKIVAQDSSHLGVMFFGTRQRDAPEGSEGVYVLQPLAPPSAGRIRQLQKMAEDIGEFHRLVGSQDSARSSAPLKQALWSSAQAFATKDFRKTDSKRIWLFTNDDHPNKKHPVEQKATVTVARDCSEAGIEISLWHLNPPAPAAPFDPKAFYFQLLVAASTGDGEDGEAIDSRMLGAGYEGFDSLLASVRRKTFKQRRLCSTCFSLDVSGQLVGQQHMAVQLFKAIHIAKKPYHTWLHAETNEPLKPLSRYYDKATGELLQPEDIETYLEAAGRKIRISKEELEELKFGSNVGGVGLRLLAFLPSSALPLDLNITSPYMLYPHDKVVKGSSVMFEALLRVCAGKGALPLVRFNRLDKATARLAILLPQLEELDEDGFQTKPPVFHLLPLPFVEEGRFCPLERTEGGVTPPAELQSAASRLVQVLGENFSFRYDQDISSPSLQQFYAVLQGVALNSGELEWQADRDDNMRPSPSLLETAAPAAIAVREAAGLFLDMGEGQGADTKMKKRSSPTASSTSKRAKVEAAEAGDAMSLESIKSYANEGRLLSFTVAQLKEMCKVVGVAVSGTKADLAGRITAAL